MANDFGEEKMTSGEHPPRRGIQLIKDPSDLVGKPSGGIKSKPVPIGSFGNGFLFLIDDPTSDKSSQAFTLDAKGKVIKKSAADLSSRGYYEASFHVETPSRRDEEDTSMATDYHANLWINNGPILRGKFDVNWAEEPGMEDYIAIFAQDGTPLYLPADAGLLKNLRVSIDNKPNTPGGEN